MSAEILNDDFWLAEIGKMVKSTNGMDVNLVGSPVLCSTSSLSSAFRCVDVRFPISALLVKKIDWNDFDYGSSYDLRDHAKNFSDAITADEIFRYWKSLIGAVNIERGDVDLFVSNGYLTISFKPQCVYYTGRVEVRYADY